jgi:hypothetical protein
MSCVAEEINNSSIENYSPPNKDGTIMLNDEIILVGNCTLSHNLEFKANGKIIIAHDAHLLITKKRKHIKISGIKQDNLIFESKSSTIDIDAFTRFYCDEEIKHTEGNLHIFREAHLTLCLNSFFHDFLGIGPCLYPLREAFKVHIDAESFGLDILGEVEFYADKVDRTYDHLEKYYGK